MLEMPGWSGVCGRHSDNAARRCRGLAEIAAAFILGRIQFTTAAFALDRKGRDEVEKAWAILHGACQGIGPFGFDVFFVPDPNTLSLQPGDLRINDGLILMGITDKHIGPDAVQVSEIERKPRASRLVASMTPLMS